MSKSHPGARPDTNEYASAGRPPLVEGIAVLLAMPDEVDDVTATVEAQQRTLDEHVRRQYGGRPSDRHTGSTGSRIGQR